MGLYGRKSLQHDWSLQVAATGGPDADINVVLNSMRLTKCI